MLAVLPFPNIDPVLFSIDIAGFTLALRWYALAYLAGFVLAYFWIRGLLRRPHLWKDGKAPMDPKWLDDLLTWMVIGVIIGGRLGFVLFYQPEVFAADPMAIFRIWEGGMAFHGGFAGVIVAGWIFCWKNGLNGWSVGDAIASSACFGLFFGRIANFIRPELWGRPTDAPWGVIFPTQAAQDCPTVPLGELCARHPSQLYEAGLEGLALFLIFIYLIYRTDALKKSGQIIAWFFIGYGAARFFVEGFRQGDAQFTGPNNPWGHVIRFGNEFDSIGLSMGQILSAPMILIGVLLLIYRRGQT